MVDFKYGAFLPSLNKSISLHELNFATYKQLVKLIQNNDNTNISAAFDNIIRQCTKDNITYYTFLDKLIALLTIRSVCIYPLLELSFNQTEDNKQQHNITFEIYNIIENISNPLFFSLFNNIKCTYKNDIDIVYGIPPDLFYESEEQLVLSTIKNISIKGNDVTSHLKDIVESLPASVYRDARLHIKNIEKEIDNISLLSVKTQSQENIEFKPSVINGSVLEFLKLCFKKDLISLYEMEYVLTAKLNLPYDIVANSTFSELMIYIGFYNEEKRVREQEEKKKFTNPLAASR